MLDPKQLLQGNPLANWKRLVFPVLDHAARVVVACWVVIFAAFSVFFAYFILRMLWIFVKLLESAIGGVSIP